MVMIAEERRKKNLTQKQLAEMMGVANSTLNQWETGLRRPNVDMLVKLARVLGCTPNDILGFEEAEPGQEKKEEGAE